MKRKLVTLVVALVMALALLPTYAMAAPAADDVAAIGETGYATLQDAVTAATEGQTVTLLKDVTYTNETITVPAGKVLTLDLNGKKIIGNFTNVQTQSFIINGGCLTIDDNSTDKKGEIFVTTTQNANICIAVKNNSANLTLNNGKISTIDNCTDSNTALAVGISSLGKSSLTVSGGEVSAVNKEGNATGISLTSQRAGAICNFTINGGTVTSSQSALEYYLRGDGQIKIDIREGCNINGLVRKTPKDPGQTLELTGFINGGTFSVEPDVKYLAEGKVALKSGANYVVESLSLSNAAAKIGETPYTSLEEAVAAAKAGETVILLKDVTENIVIAAEKNIVLDLNGKTLNGGTDVVGGKPTIHKDKPAILNNGTLVLKDTMGNGMVKRDDVKVGGESYYVIDNQGTLTIESGNVFNDSGVKGAGSSLIRNAGKNGVEGYAKLYIKGGNLHQDNFIAVKNDDHGYVEMTAGEITSKESSIQNWAQAKVTGGVLNGYIYSSVWSNDFPNSKIIITGDAKVNGTILMEKNSSSLTTSPAVEISGGSYNLTNGFVLRNDCEPLISAGTFSVDPSAYVVEGNVVVKNGANYVVEVLSLSNATAKIGETPYASLEAAVAAAKANETVTLLKDVTLENTITLDKNIVLDLGNKIVTAGEGLNVNGGKNFMFDSSANVTIQNGKLVSTVSRGIHVAAGEFNLKNVQATTFKRALGIEHASATVDKDSVLTIGEGGMDAPVVIYAYDKADTGVHPTLNFYGTADATKAVAAYAGLQGNGSDKSYTYINVFDGAVVKSNGVAIYAPQDGEVKIDGGNFIGGSVIGIKSGKLTINGGVFEATGAYVANLETHNSGINEDGSVIVIDSNGGYAGKVDVTIANGTFTSANGHIIREIGKTDEQTSVVSVAINGGEFTSALAPVNAREITRGKIAISAGYFTANPADYVVAEKTVVASDKAGYNYMVADVVNQPAEVAPTAKPDVVVPDNVGDTAAAEEVSGKLDSNVVKGEGLTEVVGEEKNENKVTTEEATKALADAKIDIPAEETAKVVVQPYMDVQIKSVNTESAKKELVIEITPMVRTVVTTTDVDNKDIDTTEGSANAVEVKGSAKEVTITKPVTMTLPIPATFAAPETTIYIKHTTKDGLVYIYESKVAADNTITFVNPHGFSEFVVGAAAPVAKIGEVGYVTVQDALNAVKENETITLQSDCSENLSAPNLTFAINLNANNFTGTISTNAKMDDKSVPGTIKFEKQNIAPALNTLFFNTYGGSEIANLQVKPGTVVDLTKYVPTKANATFDGWYKDAKYTEKVTEVKLDSNVIVHAKWIANDTPVGPVDPVKPVDPVEPVEPETPVFTDVVAGSYYEDAVKWAVEKGITTGATETTFDPTGNCTRAQAVTFLWRAAGSPVVDTKVAFTDVKADEYYAQAVAWAAANDITGGVSATEFAPNQVCSRAQIVSFLYRLAGKPAVEASNQFADVAAGQYYTDAVAWAAANGITKGATDTTFAPVDNCVRAQIVTFLYHYFVK